MIHNQEAKKKNYKNLGITKYPKQTNSSASLYGLLLLFYYKIKPACYPFNSDIISSVIDNFGNIIRNKNNSQLDNIYSTFNIASFFVWIRY